LQRETPVQTSVVTYIYAGRPGIAPEDLPYIFDRFYRGSNERKVPGSGLGLAIVRRIVEVHGGEVGVVTSTPAEGSCFEVRLPIAYL
jgi:two-component system sensor histidine kinase MprB